MLRMPAPPPDPPAAAGTAERYGPVAIALHWLLAVLITASFCVGLYMTDLPFRRCGCKLFNWHKWAGITILALSALRLLWRLRTAPPPLPAPSRMPGWQLLAHAARTCCTAVLRRAAARLGLQLGARLSGRLFTACCRCRTCAGRQGPGRDLLKPLTSRRLLPWRWWRRACGRRAEAPFHRPRRPARAHVVGPPRKRKMNAMPIASFRRRARQLLCAAALLCRRSGRRPPRPCQQTCARRQARSAS